MAQYSLTLPNRVVLIGGAGGIGRAVAMAYVSAGSLVWVLDRPDASPVEGARFLQVDATAEGSVRQAIATAADGMGGIDAVIYLVGVLRYAPPEEMRLEDWRHVIETNLTGAFLCAREAFVHLSRSPSPRLVLFASMSAHIVNKGRQHSNYVASKAGVVGLARSLAALWANRGITVNCVSPGYVRTPMTAPVFSKKDIAEFEGLTPMGRLAEPEDIVGATLFLTSAEARFITGQSLLVDGGYTLW